jgi:ribosome maturation factor RimP
MSTAERVRSIVAPLLAERSLELYDLELAGGVVKVVVDRAGGVDMEAIGDATRAISRALDEHDPMSGRYTLEVTSPGLERTLRTPAHFAGAVGTVVKVKAVAGVDGERRVEGTLVAADDDGVTLSADGVERHLRYDEIERARTVFDWGPPPRAPRTPRPAADQKRARTS